MPSLVHDGLWHFCVITVRFGGTIETTEGEIKMKRSFTLARLVGAMVLFSAASLFSRPCHGTEREINVIPTPLRVTAHEGAFSLTAATVCRARGNGAEEVMQQFCDKISASAGWRPGRGFLKKSGKDGSIVFRIDKDTAGPEAYRLSVTPQGVVASASTSDGLFYAMQTLLQLLPPQVEAVDGLRGRQRIDLPLVDIEDAPRFAYRGVMLDPCRHFLPVPAVKAQIARLAAYKINRVHWHLTDDQGWRIEIKKYPRLTEVGGSRVEGDGSVHRGYYTQEEIKEVVAFARKHHVEIVPEFEMPGHGLAAIAAYPWLSCRGDSITPRIIWGVEDIVFCPGRETTFRFIRDVLDEMVPLFPGSLFHIGGDESPRTEWAKCDSCQNRKHALGLERDAQLQSYVIERVGRYLAQKGKRLIGWDEILEGGNLDTSAVVMSWRGEEGGIEAAGKGHKVLMTPSNKGFYFDQYQSDPATEPTAIGGYTTLEKVYAYDPVPDKLRETGKSDFVLGVQANCWSEYITSPQLLEYRLYPRALALAEVGWTDLSRKDYAGFIRRADTDAAIRLKAWNVNFHIPQPEQPGGSVGNVAFTDSATLSLKTIRPLKIVYTTDGTIPKPESPVYVSPLKFSATTTVRAAAVLPCGIMSPIRTIYMEKQQPLPAQRAKVRKKGLGLTVYYGNFLKPYDFPDTPDEVVFVADLKSLRNRTGVPSSVRNVRNYAAVAEGYVDIPETGTYEFATNNNQLWLDGRLLVDNAGQPCPRYSPNNRQVVLAKGLHRIKVIFIGGIFGGWPTYWDDASVSYRLAGQNWQKLTGTQFYR